MCYQRAGLPLEIKQIHFVYPLINKDGQEELLNVDPDARLERYPQLWIELEIYHTTEDRLCIYQIRTKNNTLAGFTKTSILLLDADLFPEEKAKEVETNMDEIMENATEFLLSILQLLSE